MIINIKKSIFDPLVIDSVTEQTLFDEQKASSTEMLRNSISEWWLNNVSSNPLPNNFNADDIDQEISNIGRNAKELLGKTIDGWNYIFNNPTVGMAQDASVVTSPDGKTMVGSSSDTTSGDVRFKIKGVNLQLTSENYKISELEFEFLLPDSSIVEKFVIKGNIEVSGGIINKKTFKITGLNVDVGGFVRENFVGEITFYSEKQKNIVFEFLKIKTKNLSFSVGLDPANGTDLLTLSVSGEFYELLSDSANSYKAIMPVETLSAATVGVGSFKLNLNSLNIKSNQSSSIIDSTIVKAVQASLKKSGIDLGLKIELGNEFSLELANAKLLQSKSNVNVYTLGNATFKVSFDTKVGDSVVPFEAFITLDAVFDLSSGDITSNHITRIKINSLESDVFESPIIFDISDIKIDARSLEYISTDSIESILQGLSSYNTLLSVKSEVNFDGGIDLSQSGLSSIKNINLTSSSGESLTGNILNNQIKGNLGPDTLRGAGGADTLFGGPGSDTFVYTIISDSSIKLSDTIVDFKISDNDKIDLSSIDSNVRIYGNQSFGYTLIGSTNNIANIPKSNSIWFDPKKHIFYADVNGDLTSDFQVLLTGVMIINLNCLVL